MEYGYYSGVFGGDAIPMEAFQKVGGEAEAILSALIYPRAPERLSGAERSAFQRAVCYEAEYIYSGKADANGVKAEKLGDYSVEYRAPSEEVGVSVNGWRISPAAAGLLLQAGLTLRWV